METDRDNLGRFANGHKPLPNSGFKQGNVLGKQNKGNTYGKANKGRKAPWAKPPKHIGENNVNWNGGITIRHGYTFILRPNHPTAHKTGYIGRHRLIAELCLGRNLGKREAIHHIDDNSQNDTPSNLYIFYDSAGHSAYHCLLKYAPDLVKIISTSNLPNPSPEAKVEILDLLKIR